MNVEQDHFASRLAAQIAANGLSELRRNALKGLKLKTVIKESHCSQVQQLAFNLCDADCRNLFATVGKDQATVYDDQHMADHVAVVASLSLSNSADDCKDAFCCCCWVCSSGLTSHPYGEALLAVAGSDAFIHIISIVEAAVVARLPLPPGCAVAELSAAAERPGLLLSLCKDGTLQLWHVWSGQCCWSCRTDAFAAVLHPSGEYAVTSSRNAKLSRWTGLQHVLAAADAAAHLDAAAGAAALAAAVVAVIKEPLLLESGWQGSVVDCMRFLSGSRLATKTADGHMAVHAMPSGQQLLSSWRVPGCASSTASYSSRCCFGHTSDGQYVCVGNHNTTAFVFDATTGSQVARVEAIRVQGSVRACGLSEDCRHLLMVVGSGYVFRFEYRPPAAGSEEEEQLSEQEESEREGEAGGFELLQDGAAAGMDVDAPARASLQQQQQQQLAGAAAAHEAPEQQRPQQPGFDSPMPAGFSVQLASAGATPPPAAAPASPVAGLLTGDEGAGELLQPPSSGGLTVNQHKRPRLAGGGGGSQLQADASPLVFKPTP